MSLNRQVAKVSQVLLQYKMFSALVEHDVCLKWPGLRSLEKKKKKSLQCIIFVPSFLPILGRNEGTNRQKCYIYIIYISAIVKTSALHKL